VELPKLPIGTLGEWVVGLSTTTLKPLFVFLGLIILSMAQVLRVILLAVPPWLMIVAIGVLAWWLSGRALAAFAVLALSLQWNLELWEPTAVTLSLVLTAALLSLMVAIPLGILMAESRIVTGALNPVLDFLQTMPRFIYLIPAIIIFGIDTIGGVVATMTLAVPPPVRLTALGIREIDREVIEAGEAFGCSRWQLLAKIKLPLAVPSILLGVNQCIMMSLSMVVIAAMIGAGGLGAAILTGISRLDVGQGFEAGFGVVVVAILIDRLTKGFVARRARRLRMRTAGL
jgi:ABC-type proline/glycine betaine transport system permease subunit